MKWILLGGGGHGRVLLATLKALQWQNHLLGVVDPEPMSQALQAWDIDWLGSDKSILSQSPQEVKLINGLGSASHTNKRREIFQLFHSHGFSFLSLIHPHAWIAEKVKIGSGVQVMAGAILQTGCQIGDNVLINTRAVVDHDCRIDKHVHIASGAVLCGNVWIGAGTHIGAGATVIQEVHIGANACIGAGAVVVQNIPNGAKVVGVPAKERCK